MRLAFQKILLGGIQIVLLTVDLTHSYMHICRAAEDRRTLLCRKLQSRS